MHDEMPAGGGRSDNPGQPFDPSKPAKDEEQEDTDGGVKPTRDVPMGLPISEQDYARLKEDAARGKPLRQRRVQEDP